MFSLVIIAIFLSWSCILIKERFLRNLQECILAFLEGRSRAFCWSAEQKIGFGQRENPFGRESLTGWADCWQLKVESFIGWWIGIFNLES